MKFARLTICALLFSLTIQAQENHDVCSGYPDVKMSEAESQKLRSRLPVLRSSDASTYESNPDADKIIFLDFNGGLIMDTYWDDDGVNALPATYFTNSEKVYIAQMVATDYQPFQVNVTTNKEVYDSKPNEKRVRVVFTPTDYFREGVAGVALTGSYGKSEIVAAWVFSENVFVAAGAASHEVGHTLSLYHDGQSSGGAYYGGHNGWCPIMGYANKEKTQWSKGEYENADNTQDDVSIIAKKLPFQVDDYGSASEPSSLELVLTGVDGDFEGNGLITEAADQDVFMFKLNDIGSINVDFGCPETNWLNNLRIEAAVYDENWNLLTSNNTENTNTSIALNLMPAGVYYLVFDGIGYLNPLTNGYTDYGSLGKYTFQGTVTSYDNDLGDISITSNTKLKGYTCDELINVAVKVKNNGSKAINNYSIELAEGNGNIVEFEYNTPLQVGEEITQNLSISPTNFREWSGELTVNYSEDYLATNNNVSIGSTNYYFGRKIHAEIEFSHADYLYDPQWDLFAENGEFLFDYRDGNHLLDNGLISYDFCYPVDSCFNVTFDNPFKTNWCTTEDYDKYDMNNVAPDYEWLEGDTVYWGFGLYVLTASNGWIGYDIQMHFPFAEPHNYLAISLECDPKDDPKLTFTDVTKSEEFISLSFDKNGPDSYSYDHCLYELETYTESIDEQNNLTLFPNPASDRITIISNKKIEDVKIYAMDGRLELMDSQSSIDVSTLKPGLHFVVINGDQTTKLIIK